VLGIILGSAVGYALNGSSNKDVVADNSGTNSGNSESGGNNASSGKVDTPPATEEKSRGGDPLAEFDALLLNNSQNKKFDTDGRGAMVVKNTVTYDVVKADSIVAPYSAIITFGVIYDQSMIDLRGSDPEKAREAEATGKMPLSFSKYYRGFFDYKGGEWVFTGGYSKPHIPNFPWSKVGGKPEVGEYMENIIGQVIVIPKR